MSISNRPHDDPEGDAELLDAADAAEEIIQDDGDVAMDSGNEDNDGGDEEDPLAAPTDASAVFDAHTDSIFAIALHPTNPAIVCTGGGDDVAYVFDTTQTTPPPAPSNSAAADGVRTNNSLPRIKPLVKLTGHSDSVNAIAFTLPQGAFLATAGLDGLLQIFLSSSNPPYAQHATASEVDEINWIAPCPSPSHPNALAIGAADGSVWVYTVSIDANNPLLAHQVYYQHTGPCTAGAWDPSGTFLATVSEDGSLYVWDVWEEAAAAGIRGQAGSQAVVGLTAADERFKVEGGLYSVAIAPGGQFVAVGGAGGKIRVVGMPRLPGQGGAPTGAAQSARNAPRGASGVGGTAGAGQAGMILAALESQTESVESIAFSKGQGMTYMAAGSVDGSVVLFDWAARFGVRRKIERAHSGEAVVKVEFDDEGSVFTTCGYDGIVRRWDCRPTVGTRGDGLVKEWKGHTGGVLGLEVAAGTIVTAGDDGLSLVFNENMR